MWISLEKLGGNTLYVALARPPSSTDAAPAEAGSVEMDTSASSFQHSNAEWLLVSVTMAVAKNASAASQMAANRTRTTVRTLSLRLNSMVSYNEMEQRTE